MKLVVTGLDKLGDWARDTVKNMDEAALIALNHTAFAVKDAEYFGMQTNFDRPIPRTLKSLYVYKAKRGKLEATIEIADSFSKNNLQPREYLGPQVYGGPRGMKRHEQRLGFMTAPKNAKLDQYGNVSRNYYGKVLSQLKVMGDPAQNATNSALSKKKRKTEGFFIAGQAILSRKPKAEPVIQFVLLKRALRYKPRLPFEKIAKSIYDLEFANRYARALRKLRAP